jgi:hypothetical protein
MRNKLYIGPDPDIEIPKGGCLLLDGREWTIPAWRRPRVFDPRTCSFNPLADLDYRKRCDIVDVFDVLFSRGETTLTKDMGLEFIADLLEREPKSFKELADMIDEPDKKSSPGHIWAYNKVRRFMRSPVLSKVFCERPNFSFKRGSVNHARIDRAELGPFDANALGLFLIAQFPGQIIVPNYGPYARPFHTALIEQGRLIAGVRMLSQLKGELHDMALLMEKEAAGCTYDDAAEIAKYDCKHQPHTDGYDTFIRAAMA